MDHTLSLKEAFGKYMGRFYAGLYPDTPDLRAFTERGLSTSVVWAPDRMVDSVEDMLKAYQKNRNTAGSAPLKPGENALFPVIFVAVAKDYTPTGGDFGGRQVHRQEVALSDEPGASVYGYRQAMGDRRAQVVIMGAEGATTGSLAAQFSLFVGEMSNRRFQVHYPWGQYLLGLPCMLETPDLLFAKIEPANQGMTILAADITLKALIPYLDAPKPGEDNDGSTNDPPGYPVVEQINTLNQVTGDAHVVRVEGISRP